MAQTQFRSLRLRLLAATLLVMLISVVLVFALSVLSTYRSAKANIQQRLDGIATSLANNLSRPIYTYNDDDMERALSVISILPELVFCGIYDNNKHILKNTHEKPADMSNYLSVKVPINYKSDLKDPQKITEKLGELELIINTNSLRDALFSQIITGFLLIILLSIAITLVLLISFKKTISAPLAQLLDVLTTTRNTGKKTLAHWDSNDELGILVNAYNEVVQLHEDTETQLQEARIEAESNAEYKSSFLANMSHEIRTPLNALMGFTDVLNQTQLNENQRSYLQRVRSASSNLLSIVNDILDLAKIEAGRLQLEQQPFELQQLTNQLVDLLAQKALSKQLELFISCHQPPRLSLFGDQLRLHQILLNLVNNALKFTHQGQVELSIEQLAQQNQQSLLQFRVRDTGIGLTPEQKSRLFAPFTQAEDSTSRKYGGTGLGLNICQHLVEMMGGHIEVQSQLGQGTCFEFSLWFEHQSEQPALSLPSPMPHLQIINSSQAVKDYLQRLFTKAPLTFSPLTDQMPGVAADHWILYDSIEVEQDWPLIQAHAEANPHQPKLLICPLERKEQVLHRASLFDRIIYKPLVSIELVEWLNQIPRTNNPQLQLSGRLLVIEDEPLNQLLIAEYLKDQPIELIQAESGHEALNRYQQQQIDLILLDLHLPDQDGFSLLPQLRQLKPQLNTPVLAMTASTDKQELQTCRQAGMRAILTKPLSRHDLLHALGHWLNAKQEAQ